MSFIFQDKYDKALRWRSILCQFETSHIKLPKDYMKETTTKRQQQQQQQQQKAYK